MVSVPQFLEATPSAMGTIISGLDFTVLTSYYLEVVGVALPVLIGILAVKKGISWLMSFIHRA